MRRQLDNWIDGFLEYTNHLGSEPILKKWSAIACLAGALERRCWVHTYGGYLYPNMYIFLLAPPGIGKSQLSSLVGKLWRQCDNLCVGSTSLTKAALVDELAEARRNVTFPNRIPAVETFNSLQLSINELGTLITAYDQEFMTFLTDVYDCGEYHERRRGSRDEPIVLDKTQITLYGATTPSWLSELMPEGAWDQGFVSRSLLIYSGIKKPTSLFAFRHEPNREELWKKLCADLNSVSHLVGEFSFEPEAEKLLDSWHLAEGPPAPDHPKLAHYNTRRTAHVEKIMMALSVSEGNSLVLTVQNFRDALDILLEAEFRMPEIFKAMSHGGDSKVIEECWFAIFTAYTKNKEPVRDFIVLQFLQERIPAHSVERVLQIMVKARLLEEVQINKVGTCYKPLEYRSIT